MSYGKQHYVPGPCAYCGKPEGAVMGSSRWSAHDFRAGSNCCSDRCGYLYAESDKRLQAEIAEHEQLASHHQREASRLRRRSPAFAEAIAHARRARDIESDAENWLIREPPAWGSKNRDSANASGALKRANDAWMEAVAALVCEP